MNNDKIIERGVYACVAIVLFFAAVIVLSIAVGVFFGAGFGLLTCAFFIVFAFVCVLGAFNRVGK